ncbi:hypothetical protein D3C76_805770 [compost metagenome]
MLQLQDLPQEVFVRQEIGLAKHHVVQGGAAHCVSAATFRRDELTQQQVALELGNSAVVRVGSQQFGQTSAGDWRLEQTPVVGGKDAQVLADVGRQHLLWLPEREHPRGLLCLWLFGVGFCLSSGHGFRS